MTNINDQQIKPLSIKELLCSDNSDNYLIPMYQRNYAWGEAEISQLILDIIDSCHSNSDNNYYIGTLVVFERKQQNGQVIYETIDGQQRLTTLSLLVAYIQRNKEKKPTLNIQFENRTNSQAALEAIFAKPEQDDPSYTLKQDKVNSAILEGYKLIKTNLPKKLKEQDGNLCEDEFATYLFDNVQIIRVAVPPDTDLNHYFEIMNNRGEQLEKHEVLKARLLEVLSEQERRTAHIIWEACSNMEKYVQMGFTPEQRTELFGEIWNTLKVESFDQLNEALDKALNKTDEQKKPNQDEIPSQSESNTTSITKNLSTLINEAPAPATNKKNKDDNPERFNSVINFPNFLLQVLQVINPSEKIPLDDKQLIKTFEEHVLTTQETKTKNAKEFLFVLLRCKFLFDHNVIKREFYQGEEEWSLKQFYKTDSGSAYKNTFDDSEKNKQILMLESGFHVSSPTQSYKYWLNGALNWFSEKYNHNGGKIIQADDYLNHLEFIARAFTFDRFLAKKEKSYHDIIYVSIDDSKGACQTRVKDLNEDVLKDKLTFGNIKNNFIFNYLDYLLWKKEQNKDSGNKNPTIIDFKFTFRSSVEHHYPQHPFPQGSELDEEYLHCFGNLCLISHSKNSLLSNRSPEEKKQYYKSNNTIDSIKQYLMMKEETWDAAAITQHYDEMIEILRMNSSKRSKTIF